MTDSPLIRSATAVDADAIARIYNHYITETVVTFEVETLSAAEIAGRMEQVRNKSFPWLVAQCGDQVVGYAYANQWHVRYAYRFAAETTIYLDPAYGGRGIGSSLYGNLIEILSGGEIHTIIGGIALPNAASIALHEKFGFRKASHYRQVGFKFDQWVDVGYWQRML